MNDKLISSGESFIFSNYNLICSNDLLFLPNESFIFSNESFICSNDVLIRPKEEFFFHLASLRGNTYHFSSFILLSMPRKKMSIHNKHISNTYVMCISITSDMDF